jgi:Zn finger protein HypA/HybF involved in hydrogenase expression
MEEEIYLEYSKSSLRCKRCKNKGQNVYRFMLAGDFAPYKVEVIRLQNEYSQEDRLYRVKVVIKWNCPSCGMPLQDIKDIREIPFEILKEEFGKCPSCGGNMNLNGEKINFVSKGKMTDIIELSGEMVCDKCRLKLPLSTRTSIRLKPIWKYIKEIKKIKLSKDGIEFERF